MGPKDIVFIDYIHNENDYRSLTIYIKNQFIADEFTVKDAKYNDKAGLDIDLTQLINSNASKKINIETKTEIDTEIISIDETSNP